MNPRLLGCEKVPLPPRTVLTHKQDGTSASLPGSAICQRWSQFMRAAPGGWPSTLRRGGASSLARRCRTASTTGSRLHRSPSEGVPTRASGREQRRPPAPPRRDPPAPDHARSPRATSHRCAQVNGACGSRVIWDRNDRRPADAASQRCAPSFLRRVSRRPGDNCLPATTTAPRGDRGGAYRLTGRPPGPSQRPGRPLRA